MGSSKGGSKAPTPVPLGAYLVGSNTPYGSTAYRQTGTIRVKGGPDQPQYTQDVTLSPAQRRLLTTQDSANQGMANRALSDIHSGIGGQNVQQALYAKQTAMLDPQYKQEGAHVAAQLAAQGVNPGSGAYDQAMANFARAKNNAYAGARADSILAGGQEESRRVNEIQTLLGHNVQMPQDSQGGMNAASNAASSSNQSRMLSWQQGQQNQQDSLNALLGLGGTLGMAGILHSDIRLKEHLKKAGKLGPYQLWTYNFKGEDKRRLGVIAQEVEKISPHLVHQMPDGFLGVNYLGIIDVL